MKNILKFLPFLPIALMVPYFVFIHPAIIYYNGEPTSLNTPNGKAALFYLALSFLLWGWVFGYALYILFKSGIGAKINMRRMEASGRAISGIIREVKKVKKNNDHSEAKEITLEANNFSHERIKHTIAVNDTEPKEKRYETGKKVQLIVDPDFKRYPFVFIAGSQAKINYIPYIVWFLFLLGVVYYYTYAYAHENGGNGWRFLELFHPLLVSPAALIFFSVIFYFIIKVFAGNPRKKLKLKFWGQLAVAKVTQVKQTGTYINEQPQVKYDLEFRDKNGKIYQTSKKEVVSLMDIGRISSLRHREVFYMPDDPKNFTFSDDLNY
ncbi:hypothetical protein VUJ46_01325 [Chryseobacterium sp. MYb264]|uniref:hypothetical protein n=1 Tax=Chryseobacterium sp. MYb264 TaxID=2745153 RepID=UPI002E0FE25C|nr:hypothetical protein VUJ46_01325 [Chryseobacterium sp. MYb264]